MDKQNIINKVLHDSIQVVSNDDIDNIVNKFVNIPAKQLSQFIKNSELDNHFTIKFINKHEHFINPSDKSVHICHNMKENTDTSDEIYILIHGLGGSLEQFLPLFLILDQLNKPFLAMDLPGFGKSDELNTYTMSDTVKHIDQILSQLTSETSLQKKNLNILGHSMGCYLTLHFLNEFNDKYNFNKLILLAPPGPDVDTLAKDKRLTQLTLRFLFKWPQFFTFYREWFDQSKGLESSGIKSFFHDDTLNDVNKRETLSIRKYWKLFQYRNNINIKSRSIIGYLLGWESIDWTTLNVSLKNQDCQIYIVCGDKDTVTKLEVGEQLRQSFADKSKVNFITIKDCSHNICLDAMEEISDKFLDFI